MARGAYAAPQSELPAPPVHADWPPVIAIDAQVRARVGARWRSAAIGVVIGALLLVWTATATATPAPQPDFDGDGHADLAVGAPYTNAGARDSGAVHVFHGSPGGLRVVDRQVWSEASPGLLGQPQEGSQFGWSIAAGDFDGDGFSDLAIGARFETRDAWHAGVVHVIYGSPDGLSSARNQRWYQGSRGIGDRPEWGDQFGRSLAANDFNGDGRDDLAIGVQAEDRRGKDSGVVHVIYGSTVGLTAKGSQLWHQDRPEIADRSEALEGFGRSLTAGDFDGDGFAELAIGVPYEDGTVDRMGVAHILRGTRRGLSAHGSQLWHQDSPGILEHAELRDQFGQSIAAGDIDRDGFDDLVVGVWYEDHRNELSNEGGFHVIFGSRRGLCAEDNEWWHQDRDGTKDRRHDSDRFGQALAVADVDGDGFDDVAVGSASSDLGMAIHQNRGAIHVFRGSRSGLTAKGDQYINQDTQGVPGRSRPVDHFGESLAAADFDGDGRADLAIGIPWKDVTLPNEGAVYVIQGSAYGLDVDRDRLLRPGGSGLGLGQRRGGRFGWAMASEKTASGTARVGAPDV